MKIVPSELRDRLLEIADRSWREPVCERGVALFEFDLDPADQSGNEIVERRRERAADDAHHAINDGKANQVNEPNRQAAEGAQTAADERAHNPEEKAEDRGQDSRDFCPRNDADAFQYLHDFLPLASSALLSVHPRATPVVIDQEQPPRS